MILTLEQQQAILRAGGGMVLDASAYTFNQLLDLASAAKTGPARIELRRVSGLTQGQMLELAIVARPSARVVDANR